MPDTPDVEAFGAEIDRDKPPCSSDLPAVQDHRMELPHPSTTDPSKEFIPELIEGVDGVSPEPQLVGSDDAANGLTIRETDDGSPELHSTMRDNQPATFTMFVVNPQAQGWPPPP